MKIGVISDIHLEFGEYDRDFGTGDVLLVPGDLHVAAYIHSQHPSILSQDMKGRSERFFKRALESYDHVITVMGNHEHYQGILNYTQKIIKDHFPDPRLHHLEKEAVHIKGVNFFGATFWTDFNRNDPHTKLQLQGYMNDYASIQVLDSEDTLERRALHPNDLYAEHQATLLDLADIVYDSKEAGHPLVVLSHHAGSKRSTHPRYRDQYEINGGYSSDLEHLMGPHIPLWVHGHTHDNHDYTIKGTRKLCNPRGYVGHHLNPLFQPQLTVEI